MTEEEKEILEATKEFADIHNIPYDNRIESMILNAMRERVKNCYIPDVVKSLPNDTNGCSNDRDKCSCKDWGGCPVD